MHPNPYSRWRMAVFVVVTVVAALYVVSILASLLLAVAGR
ncbi:hypothetical protein GCM10009850_027400 [Nonomuraea monospora]|uniref:Uncharacterized protein n=1 Tax=Nonomuraea monospora TaxID=568818 RepID=A0ABN3CD20_9ACTN